ncbi:hypothetical protein LSAT2_017900 [Lamellibrachia satsuma]|nr:hypothetical protein LSAT2_017900 [Lamellibrachia satsuma]
MSNVFVTDQRHVQCCDYFGNNPQVYNVTGHPRGLAVENDVVYYSQDDPHRVGSIQLKTGLHTSLNMGSYNDSYTYSMAYLHGECSMSGRSGFNSPLYISACTALHGQVKRGHIFFGNEPREDGCDH